MERKLQAPASGIASSSASAEAQCCRTLSPSSSKIPSFLVSECSSNNPAALGKQR